MTFIVKTFVLGLIFFIFGCFSGAFLVTIPSIRSRIFAHFNHGFSTEELSGNINLKDLAPASTDEDYSRTMKHL